MVVWGGTGANYFTRQEVPPKKQALESSFFVHEREKFALSPPPFSHRSDLGRSSLALPAEVLTLSSSGLIAVACKSGDKVVSGLYGHDTDATSSHIPWLHTILPP